MESMTKELPPIVRDKLGTSIICINAGAFGRRPGRKPAGSSRTSQRLSNSKMSDECCGAQNYKALSGHLLLKTPKTSKQIVNPLGWLGRTGVCTFTSRFARFMAGGPRHVMPRIEHPTESVVPTEVQDIYN